jgi:predicted ArsR family transcriptional regulator
MSDSLIAAEVNELLQSLTETYFLPALDPALDVVVTMLAKSAGISQRGARDILEKGIESGELEKHRARDENGHPVFAYRRK